MIVVTGGAGYIGSVAVEELIKEDYEVVVVDDLSDGHRDFVPGDVDFFEGDFSDPEVIRTIADRYDVQTVMHFAAQARVAESVRRPDYYWEENVVKTKSMIDSWIERGVEKFIFSSTAAVYGEPDTIPISEDDTRDPINAYGHTKLAIEWYFDDLSRSDSLAATSLRYFNAAGAGDEVGEDHDPETHLIPLLLRAVSEGSDFEIYGTDYPTRDGTCLRDFIHVKDIARAHILAMENLSDGEFSIYNIGQGDGTTVREIVDAVQAVTGEDFTVKKSSRRPGDPARLVADPSKIKRELGWQIEFDLEDIIEDAWDWHQTLSRSVPSSA